jgi:hypothetical protein
VLEELTGIDSPVIVMQRLSSIERDMAERQGAYERAADSWFRARREQSKNYAEALLRSQAPSVTAQKADADIAAYLTDGAEFEAEYEATRHVLELLQKRASILQSILRSQGLAG